MGNKASKFFVAAPAVPNGEHHAAVASSASLAEPSAQPSLPMPGPISNARAKLAEDSCFAADVSPTTRPASSAASPRPMVTAMLSKSGLDAFPVSLFDLCGSLHWIDLSENSLTRLPDSLSRFVKLRRLGLGSNHLSTLPADLCSISTLTWLDCTRNDLVELPANLGQLKHLVGLGISNCRLSSLPHSIGALQRLQKLGAYQNRLTALPSSFCQLAHLTKLDLSNNSLERLPRDFGRLSSLVWINLSNNRLQELPDSLSQCTRIVELGLGGNRLVRLPNLAPLSQLSILPLYINQLGTVDGAGLDKLACLVKLDLSANMLESIPPGIFSLPKLTYLNLKGNLLSRLESEDDLVHAPLEALFISHNLLTAIPCEIVEISKRVKEFRCEGNPIDLSMRPFIDAPFHSLKLRLANHLTSSVLPVEQPLEWPPPLAALFAERKRKCQLCRRRYYGPCTRSVAFRKASKEDDRRLPISFKHCSYACALGNRRILESHLTHAL